MERDLEKSKLWALDRAGKFLSEIEFSSDPIEIEAKMDLAIGALKLSRDTFHKVNCENQGCVHLNEKGVAV